MWTRSSRATFIVNKLTSVQRLPIVFLELAANDLSAFPTLEIDFLTLKIGAALSNYKPTFFTTRNRIISVPSPTFLGRGHAFSIRNGLTPMRAVQMVGTRPSAICRS